MSNVLYNKAGTFYISVCHADLFYQVGQLKILKSVMCFLILLSLRGKKISSPKVFFTIPWDLQNSRDVENVQALFE